MGSITEAARHPAAGLALKKPSGLSVKPTEATGMTGQSSILGICVWPKLYQTTTSVASRPRSSLRPPAEPPVSEGSGAVPPAFDHRSPSAR